MDAESRVACGFLGGTILSVEGGYRVLQHPRPERVFDRIADARWFLAVSFCDHCPTPDGILNHEGRLSFKTKRRSPWAKRTFCRWHTAKPSLKPASPSAPVNRRSMHGTAIAPGKSGPSKLIPAMAASRSCKLNLLWLRLQAK